MTSEGKVKYSWSLPDRQKILARGGNETDVEDETVDSLQRAINSITDTCGFSEGGQFDNNSSLGIIDGNGTDIVDRYNASGAKHIYARQILELGDGTYDGCVCFTDKGAAGRDTKTVWTILFPVSVTRSGGMMTLAVQCGKVGGILAKCRQIAGDAERNILQGRNLSDKCMKSISDDIDRAFVCGELMMNPGFEEEFPSYGDFAEYAGGALSYARKKMKMPPYLPETAPFHMYATVYIPMHGPLQELKFASIASMGIRTSLDLSGIRQSDKVERFMEDVKKEGIFS